MASKDDGKTSGTPENSTQSGRPKTQPQTIDLEAADVTEAAKGPKTEKTDEKKPDESAGSAKMAEEKSGTRSSGPATTQSKMQGAPDAAGAAKSTTSQSQPTPSGSTGSLLTGALGGGVVGAALIYGLAFFGLIPGAGDSEEASEQIAQLRQSVAAVESRVDAAEPATEVDLSGVETAIADLREQVTAIEASGADTGALDAVAERIKALENAAAERDGTDGSIAEGLATRIDEVEAGTAEMASQIEALRSEFTNAAAAIAEGEGIDLSGIETRLSALETATAGTADAIAEAIAAIPAPDLTGVENAQAALTSSIDNLAARTDAVETQVSELSGTVETLAGDIAGVQSSAGALDDERRAAYLVALSGLQRASAGSGPFAAELDAVRALADDEAAFAGLADYAATGVPSAAELARSFSALTGTILDETAKASADGVLGRLAAGAQTLVRIRPTGYVAGDSPAAAVARIEVLLADGKLAAALDEWESLPEPGKAASAAWAAQLRDRLALNAALSGSPATN